MTAVLQRLPTVAELTPILAEGLTQWTFGRQLKTKDTEFFKPIITQHTLLDIEYNTLCIQLVHDYCNPQKTEEEITEQLIAALMLAELLAHIYKNYLAVSRELIRLQEEQKIYRLLLIDRKFSFPSLEPLADQSKSFSQEIRQTTATTNWTRLILVRSKRLLNAITPLVKNFEQYNYFILALDKYTNPVIAHLSWVFFIPRLTINLLVLFKHLVPGSWMSKEEAELPWQLRLTAQLQRRWFELGNDIPWMTGGLLNCFVWIGPWAPIGVYVNLALFVYDVILASIRAIIELTRLNKLLAEYKQMPGKETAEYQAHLQTRINYEFKRLMISVINTTFLAVAIVLSLPSLAAASPILPIIGAVILLASTIAAYLATKIIEKQQPVNKINTLVNDEKTKIVSRNSFFQPAPVNEAVNHTVNNNLPSVDNN